MNSWRVEYYGDEGLVRTQVHADRAIVGDSGVLMFFEVGEAGSTLVRGFRSWESCELIG